jgi:hypothetical protein
MTALSIRIDPETERLLQAEVMRRKTTKTKLVQELLRTALAPTDTVNLLETLRREHGLDALAQNTAPTEQSTQVKQLVRQAVAQKHRQTAP